MAVQEWKQQKRNKRKTRINFSLFYSSIPFSSLCACISSLAAAAAADADQITSQINPLMVERGRQREREDLGILLNPQKLPASLIASPKQQQQLQNTQEKRKGKPAAAAAAAKHDSSKRFCQIRRLKCTAELAGKKVENWLCVQSDSVGCLSDCLSFSLFFLQRKAAKWSQSSKDAGRITSTSTLEME